MKQLIGMILAISSLYASTFAAVAASQEAIVTIKGMMCSSCAKKVQTELMKNPSVAKVDVNYKKGLVDIAFKDGKNLSDQEITQAVKASAMDDNEYSVGSIARK